MWFLTEAHFEILIFPLDSWPWNESGVISDFDFESRLSLDAKRCKLKLTVSTVCLKKCNILQTKPNIGNIYIKLKNFSPRVWIRDRYLKIRPHLEYIKVWSFVCMRKRANFSGNRTWHTGCHLAKNLMRIPKSLRLAGEAARVGRKCRESHNPPPPCATMKLHCPSSSCQTTGVHQSTSSNAVEPACAECWRQEGPQTTRSWCLLERKEKQEKRRNRRGRRRTGKERERWIWAVKEKWGDFAEEEEDAEENHVGY